MYASVVSTGRYALPIKQEVGCVGGPKARVRNLGHATRPLRWVGVKFVGNREMVRMSDTNQRSGVRELIRAPSAGCSFGTEGSSVACAWGSAQNPTRNCDADPLKLDKAVPGCGRSDFTLYCRGEL
jgi:hypothetical protein